MEQKTKEIVERLRERAVGQKPVPDGKGGFRWEIYHRDTELETAADLITRLSERVGELERLWGERCMTEIESQSALSKQGEGS